MSNLQESDTDFKSHNQNIDYGIHDRGYGNDIERR